MSKIYGLYGGSHNANIAYIENGNIIAVIEEERITRIKSGDDFEVSPLLSLQEIVKMTGVELKNADYVCWAMPSPKLYRKTLNLKNEVFYEHHDCHAAGAYYTSGFKEKTLIITLDGGGRRSYGKVFIGENSKLTLVHSLPMSTNGSLGQVWAQLTEALGWKMLKDEGKVMGMAGHGEYDETLYKYIKSCITYENLHFGKPHSGAAAEFLGKKLNEMKLLETKKQKADLAYNLQIVTEELVLKYIKELAIKYYDCLKLVVAGGIFANVKLNKEINELEEFNEMYVMPPMGDDGLGLGAAILKAVELGEMKNKRFTNVFLGKSYTEEEIHNEDKNYDFIRFPYLPNEIAVKLNEGEIIGFFKGRFEHGPRALGARSILVRPTDKGTHKKLNDRLKRHDIMPFAPIVLGEHANEIFHCDKSLYTAEFMTMCYETRKEWVNKIPAVIHEVDNTARPQVVFERNNPAFYEILQEYYFVSKIPVLLNTSFNGHGEPILDNPKNAMDHLNKGTIDLLVIGNNVYYKNKEIK